MATLRASAPSLQGISAPRSHDHTTSHQPQLQLSFSRALKANSLKAHSIVRTTGALPLLVRASLTTSLPSAPEPKGSFVQSGAREHQWDKRTSVDAHAATAAEGAGVADSGDPSELVKTIQLGSLFGMWYLFNIYFNIYNKQVLKVFPYPLTVTAVQFAVGSVVVLLMWAANIHKRPKVTKAQLLAILPLAAVHSLGNSFTNVSLGRVAVSFTHTIKALEPFFSVLLSALVLGEQPTLPVILCLLPVVGGVALASATEASFNWAGFLAAMASNLTFQSRNVLSKKLMIKKDASMDNINLFSLITLLSFLLLLPVALLTEGVKFTPQFMAARGLDVQRIMVRSVLAALCFHAYQQVSYMILQRVSPVTHSVGNCVKRVIVIVTSVLFFRTPVSAINAVGTGIALAGVFGYSRVKASKPKAS